MGKYVYSELTNSQWVEKEIIQAKNRKRVKETIKNMNKYKLQEGLFKLRKLSD